jgi:hypothetical protein
VDAIAEGMAARSLREELATLEARRAEIERGLAAAPDPKPLLHPNLAEIYRRKVADLHLALNAQNTRAAPRPGRCYGRWLSFLRSSVGGVASCSF